MNAKLFPSFLAVVCVLAWGHNVQADWTRFRGPNGSGICAEEKPTPVHWSPSANLKWKTALPGPGVSCPIVIGGRVYVTCYSGYGLDRENPGDQKNLKRHLLCLEAKTGEVIWNATIDPVLPEDDYSGIGVPAHGYASHTPVSDGENVFVFFGKSGAAAFDQDGKKLWQASVGKESDARRWGSASSPILYKNLLIVPATAESEAVIALDKKTGSEVWRQEAAGLAASWSTPILVESEGNRTDLVLGVPNEIWGLNPENGKLRWYCQGPKGGSFCSSVVAENGVVYAVGERGGGSIAVRAGGTGDVTASHVVWTGSENSRFSSPVLYKDRIYSVAGDVASVTDAKTGERITRTRLTGGREGGGGRMGGDYASPVMAGGKLYFVRSSGDLFVLNADEKLEVVALNRVTNDKEEFASTPAISQGELFIRSDKHLYCVAPMGQEIPEGEIVRRDDSEGSPAEEGVERGEGGRGGDERGGGRFDPAQIFQRNDANSDGKLTGDEIPERTRGRLEEIDKDKDGALTLEEFQSGMGRGRRGGPGGDRNPREGKPDRPQRPAMEE